MIVRNRNIFWTILAIGWCAVLALAGCTADETADQADTEAGLVIQDMTTSIGAADGNPEVQRFRYNLTISNPGEEELVIRWLEPVFTGPIQERVLSEERRQEVEEVVPPNTTIQVGGTFLFDASGLTKEEIGAMEPFIEGFRVGSERVIQVP